MLTSGSARRLSRRCSTARRRAALALARPGRDADPFRHRIVHGRARGARTIRSDRIPAAALNDSRDIALIKAAVKKSGWQRPRCRGKDQRGATCSQVRASPIRRAMGQRVAIVARGRGQPCTGTSGRRIRRGALCGQIVNPAGARARASRATSSRGSAARRGK